MLTRIEADALLRLGQVEEAKPLLTRAIAKVSATAPGDPVRGDLLLSLGRVEAQSGRVANALSAMQRAYAVFVRAGRNREASKSLLYVAGLYDDAKDYGSAVKYLRQAAELQSADADLSLSIYNNLGGALKELGRYDEARQSYATALPLAARRGALPEAQVLSGLARTALLTGDLGAADRYTRSALRLAGEGEARVLRPMLTVVQAQVAMGRREPRLAVRLLEPVFRGADLSATSLDDREAHEVAWRAYRAAGMPAKALVHLQALKRLDDEATKLATSTKTALMAARFDFANQELRIATLKADELRHSVAAERNQTRLERLIFAGVAGVTLVILALLGIGLFTIGRSRNAVRAANADLGRINDELERALAARTAFLATTSHEIRTPLNGILGMTQVMLAGHGLDDGARDRLEVVRRAGLSMRVLVDDILDAAKIESGRLTLETGPFDLGRVVEEAVALWEPAIRAKGIRFSAAIDLPDRAVVGDEARVRQIAANLLSNAAKFTQEGEVRLTVRWAGGRASFTVVDTGVGIAPEKLEEVFEPFQQADAGVTRRFGGTGLGLSISRRLAQAMGGDVTVRSTLGAGSCFTVALPLPQADGEAAVVADRPSEAAPTLIVVDPSPITRAMLRTMFERAGARVACAATPEELLASGAGRGTRVLLDGTLVPEGAPGALLLAQLAAGGAHATTLLWPADRQAPDLPRGYALVRKPISGPALVTAVLDVDATDRTTGLVSRAA